MEAAGWAALLASHAIQASGRAEAACNLARIVAVCALIALGRRGS